MSSYNSTHTGTEHDLYATKSELINLIYPIGSIYISVSSTSPATLFGGTWEQIENRFLLAAGSSYVAGSTGGTASGNTGDTALTIAQMPKHNHRTLVWDNNNSDFVAQWATGTGYTTAKYGGRFTSVAWQSSSFKTAGNTDGVGGTGDTVGSTTLIGGGQAHSHTIDKMPPYLVVNIWKRIS